MLFLLKFFFGQERKIDRKIIFVHFNANKGFGEIGNFRSENFFTSAILRCVKKKFITYYLTKELYKRQCKYILKKLS